MKMRCRFLAYAATRDSIFKTPFTGYLKGQLWSTPAASGNVAHDRDYEMPEYHDETGLICITSYVSDAHAMKLAREAYTYWKRHPEKFLVTDRPSDTPF